jgi:hypothetical protein
MAPRSLIHRAPGAAVVAVLLALTIRVPEAPATVAEQRARLPPAAECEDEIEGKWRAHTYSEMRGRWAEFTLEVHRVKDSPTALTGFIKVHSYQGGPEDTEPGPCEGLRFTGQMPGYGTFQDGQVAFGSSQFEVTEVLCGDFNSVRYNPDNFTGRIEPERQEFQSVNNDGGSAVNEPAVFRRIACYDDEAMKPAGDVKPPPFFPARKQSGGCGVAW